MSAFRAILAKDLTVELRLRQVLPTMFVLALVLVTVFGLAASAELRRSAEATAAVLWLAFAFAGLLAVERAFASEVESRTFPALLAAPVSAQTIFAAKCAASLAMLAAVQLVTLPLAAVFLEVTVSGPVLPLVAVVVLGDVALVLIGTLAGAMVAAARTRGPLLTVVVLPLLIPVLVTSATCTAELAAWGLSERAARLLGVLAAFDLLCGAAAWLLAPHVMES